MNHRAMRLNVDKTVHATLDNAVACEQKLVRKRSSVVRAEKTHMSALNVLCHGGEAPTFSNDTRIRLSSLEQ